MDSRVTHASGNGPAAPAKRCLLLVPRGYDAPLDLLDGFRRRGVAIREVPDAAAAMVALAREKFVALVILEPDAAVDAGKLYHAVRRYHPGTPVWQYRWASDPRLAHYANGTPPLAAAGNGHTAPALPKTAPALPPRPPASALPDTNGRASSGVPMSDARKSADAEPPQPRRMSDADIREAASLTEEELAMLLDDPPRRGQSA
jgi:hypothetical protein